MKIGGTAADGEILYLTVFPKTIGYDRAVLPALSHLDLFLIKPDVKTAITLLEVHNIKVVYKYVWKDRTK